jgi:hypothetical protein
LYCAPKSNLAFSRFEKTEQNRLNLQPQSENEAFPAEKLRSFPSG